MTDAAYHAWAVLDIERHEDIGPARMRSRRGDLQALVSQSLVDVAVPEVAVVPGSAPERLVLGFVPETPPDVVGTSFPVALARRLAEADDGRDPRNQLRLTFAVHDARVAGAFAEVLWMANAPVLRNVLAAARRRSVMAIAVSERWYADVVVDGAGYRRVRSGTGTFWIHVPGTSVPPGLSPTDVAIAPRPSPTRSGGRTVNVTIEGGF